MEEILRFKNFIIAGAIIVVFLIINQSISLHYKTQIDQFNQDKAIIESGRETITRWENVESELAALAAEFFRHDTTDFKRYVEDQALRSDVRIENVSMSTRDQDFYSDILINMKVESSYRALIDFLELMEIRRIELDSFTISSRLGHSGLTSLVDAEMTARGLVVK